MSTMYRIIVSCDEKATGDCHGFIEVSGRVPRGDEALYASPVAQTWLRGYSREGSYDVCPSCRKLVEERLPAPAPEKGSTD